MIYIFELKELQEENFYIKHLHKLPGLVWFGKPNDGVSNTPVIIFNKYTLLEDLETVLPGQLTGVHYLKTTLDLDLYQPNNLLLAIDLQQCNCNGYNTKFGCKRRIVSAANLTITETGERILVVGPRHYDNVMREQYMRLPKDIAKLNNTVQGFVDNVGEFHNRTEALKIAIASKQLIGKHGNGYELFSEDLY